MENNGIESFQSLAVSIETILLTGSSRPRLSYCFLQTFLQTFGQLTNQFSIKRCDVLQIIKFFIQVIAFFLQISKSFFSICDRRNIILQQIVIYSRVNISVGMLIGSTTLQQRKYSSTCWKISPDRSMKIVLSSESDVCHVSDIILLNIEFGC